MIPVFEESADHLGGGIATRSVTKDRSNLGFNRLPIGWFGLLLEKPAVANAALVFAVSPDGLHLALSASVGGAAAIVLYTGKNWTEPVVLPTRSGTAIYMSFSPDGQRLAVGTIRGLLTVFSVTERKELWTVPAYDQDQAGIQSLAYTQDGRFIATGSTGGLHDRK